MGAYFDVGSWGLFCGQDGRQLVLVGDEPCGPSSARKQMRRIPRELLLEEDRLAQVYRTKTGIAEKVMHDGQGWSVTVQPKLSPRSGSVVGAFAIVLPAGAATPELPLVGGWEWEIELDENLQPTPQRRTYWDRALYDIYAVEPGVDQQSRGYWQAGEWANELISKSDQMRVNSLVRDGIQEGLTGVGEMGVTGTIRCLTYDVVTGYGSEVRGRRHLRLVGQIVPVKPGDEKILIQGFSYEVPDSFHDMAFVRDVKAGRVDDVLRGVMSLTREPMAVVDVETLELLMTSTSWREGGFGHVGGLGQFTVDNCEEVQAFIRAAAEDTENSRFMQVDLRRSDGSVQSIGMTVLGVRSGVQGRDAVLRLDL